MFPSPALRERVGAREVGARPRSLRSDAAKALPNRGASLRLPSPQPSPQAGEGEMRLCFRAAPLRDTPMNAIAPRTSGTAIASLVFGILSWCVLPFIGAILAVIFGHSAHNEIRRAPPGTIEGDG